MKLSETNQEADN